MRHFAQRSIYIPRCPWHSILLLFSGKQSSIHPSTFRIRRPPNWRVKIRWVPLYTAKLPAPPLIYRPRVALNRSSSAPRDRGGDVCAPPRSLHLSPLRARRVRRRRRPPCRSARIDLIKAHDVWSSIIQQHGIVLAADSNIDWWNIGAPVHVAVIIRDRSGEWGFFDGPPPARAARAICSGFIEKSLR